MLRQWEACEEVAAGAICPMPDCGELVIALKPTSADEHGLGKPWEFTCPRCELEFTVPEDELMFQSVPKEWVLARIQAA
jgi:hypothetical protein